MHCCSVLAPRLTLQSPKALWLHLHPNKRCDLWLFGAVPKPDFLVINAEKPNGVSYLPRKQLKDWIFTSKSKKSKKKKSNLTFMCNYDFGVVPGIEDLLACLACF